jgi:hypothetical protein
VPVLGASASRLFPASHQLLCSRYTEKPDAYRHAASPHDARAASRAGESAAHRGPLPRCQAPGRVNAAGATICLDSPNLAPNPRQSEPRSTTNHSNRPASPRSQALVPEITPDQPRLPDFLLRPKLSDLQEFRSMELAGLEPATSWVRWRGWCREASLSVV